MDDTLLLVGGDAKLTALVQMLPNFDPDVVAAEYYHNSKNAEVALAKLLSKVRAVVRT